MEEGVPVIGLVTGLTRGEGDDVASKGGEDDVGWP